MGFSYGHELNLQAIAKRGRAVAATIIREPLRPFDPRESEGFMRHPSLPDLTK
jgi:hypothetical protein